MKEVQVNTFIKDHIINELTEEISEFEIDMQMLEADLDFYKTLVKKQATLIKSSQESFDLLYEMYVDVLKIKR